MLAEKITDIDKIIEIISEYVEAQISAGQAHIGTVTPMFYKEELAKIEISPDKNKALHELLSKYVNNDNNLIPKVWPYYNVEYPGYVLEIIDVIKELDEFKTVYLKEVLDIMLRVNRDIIETDMHTKYLLYRLAQTVYSEPEMDIMKKSIFNDVLHVYNQPVKMEEVSCLTCHIETLEFMQYMDTHDVSTASHKISQFLEPLIQDFQIKRRLKVDKITDLNSCFNMVFIGVKDKKLIEKFINELPNTYRLFRQAEGNANFGYSQHQEVVYKYLDYLVLDHAVVEKNTPVEKQALKI